MQDNEPLMRALSNLINLNQPDLVLFVGEALVGNDAGEEREHSWFGFQVLEVQLPRKRKLPNDLPFADS